MESVKPQDTSETDFAIELPDSELLNEWFSGEIVSERELSKDEVGDCYSEYNVYVRYNDG